MKVGPLSEPTATPKATASRFREVHEFLIDGLLVAHETNPSRFQMVDLAVLLSSSLFNTTASLMPVLASISASDH